MICSKNLCLFGSCFINRKLIGACYVNQTQKRLVLTWLELLLSHFVLPSVKLQLHEGDNLDERIITIPCKRVYGATQTRHCEKSGCSRLRCTVKVSNKTRLFRSHEQLRCPAKKLSFQPLADAADVDDFGGTSHLSRKDRKTFACHRKSA